MRFFKDQKGFSLAELLIVVAIMGILATVVIMNLGGSETGAKEAKLKANLRTLRQAIIQYKSDHGFFACTQYDKNKNGDQKYFRRQMTWYTNKDGAVSSKRTSEYRFGPYLQEFPDNPFYPGTNTAVAKNVVINRNQERLLENLKKDVAKWSGNYGWYYEAKSGHVVANLGGKQFSDDYCYY